MWDAVPMTVRRCVLLACAVLALTAGPGAGAQDLTREQMEEDLHQMTEALRKEWSYLDDKKENFGVDIDRLHADTKGRLDDTMSRVDFVHLLEEHVASLKDGHASVRAPGVNAYGGRYLTIYLREVKEGLAIAYRPPGAPEGLNRGDLVLEWDGKTAEAHIRDGMKRTCASTETSRRHRAIRLLTVQ